MDFSDYKYIGQTQAEFGITFRQKNFVLVQDVAPSEFFLQELEFTLQYLPYRSESARAETLIFPILREVYKSYRDKFTLWSHEPIAYDAKLNGTPDYLLATQSPLGKTILEKPLLALVEAKKNDFEYGWGQCLAELVAAQKINGDPERTVFGIVTDGEMWQIGKLEKDLFTQNILSFPTGDVSWLFGALHFVFGTLAL